MPLPAAPDVLENAELTRSPLQARSWAQLWLNGMLHSADSVQVCVMLSVILQSLGRTQSHMHSGIVQGHITALSRTDHMAMIYTATHPPKAPMAALALCKRQGRCGPAHDRKGQIRQLPTTTKSLFSEPSNS